MVSGIMIKASIGEESKSSCSYVRWGGSTLQFERPSPSPFIRTRCTKPMWIASTTSQTLGGLILTKGYLRCYIMRISKTLLAATEQIQRQ